MTLNKQQIFDKVWTHFVTNKGLPSFKASTENSYGFTCLYRSPEGNRCAIGVLIPDDRYDPSFEGKLGDGIIKNYFPDLVDLKDNEMSVFLSRLQSAHDNATIGIKGCDLNRWPEVIRSQLLHVAALHNLTIEGKSCMP